jgi:predicted ATPase
MTGQFIGSLNLKGFLSFGPESEAVNLTPLNVLIGPNGSGKSNFIEALELLHALPGDLSDAVRIGGTAGEWLWKGSSPPAPAIINARLMQERHELSYRLSFTQAKSRLEILDEALEESAKARPDAKDVFFYYRYQNGRPAINVRSTDGKGHTERKLKREDIHPEQSVLSQRKDPDLYPELTRVARDFGRIRIFREWGFGRSAILRQPQPANLPVDAILPNLVNLGLVLNNLEHGDGWPRFVELMQGFLPRFSRLTTKVEGGTVQIFLHENGLRSPIPATRLSDGTIRFMALLAILLDPGASSLLCIEEPELGVHPDALTLIADLLVEASEKTQVVVTTHSDGLVSALTEQADSVLVSDYMAGGTEFKRLESDKLKHWLDKYKLGEIWRIGKVGGNPW